MSDSGMTYAGYVAAAYAVFVVVLMWDAIAPLLRIRRTLRNVSLRAKRTAARQAPISSELQR
jgi:heme exporter protein D